MTHTVHETSGHIILKSNNIPAPCLQLVPDGRWRMDGGDEGYEGGSEASRMKRGREGRSEAERTKEAKEGGSEAGRRK